MEFKRNTEQQFNLIVAMNEIVMSMNHEGAQDIWFYTYPDGADEEEIREMANDNDLFDGIVESFFRICKVFGKDGLCTLTYMQII